MFQSLDGPSNNITDSGQGRVIIRSLNLGRFENIEINGYLKWMDQTDGAVGILLPQGGRPNSDGGKRRGKEKSTKKKDGPKDSAQERKEKRKEKEKEKWAWREQAHSVLEENKRLFLGKTEIDFLELI